LTELDTILFIKQICEGIRHMHQMYILHLDLKVEWLSILTNTESSQLFPKCLLGALSAIYQLRKFLLLLLMFLGTNKNLDFFFSEVGSCCISQTGHELLGSSYPPVLASQVADTTGSGHHTQQKLVSFIFNFCHHL
jgi:serine/threonine protein kinase